MRYCRWEIMFAARTVYAFLPAAPPTPLIPLPGYRTHRCVPTTTHLKDFCQIFVACSLHTPIIVKKHNINSATQGYMNVNLNHKFLFFLVSTNYITWRVLSPVIVLSNQYNSQRYCHIMLLQTSFGSKNVYWRWGNI